MQLFCFYEALFQVDTSCSGFREQELVHVEKELANLFQVKWQV